MNEIFIPIWVRSIRFSVLPRHVRMENHTLSSCVVVVVVRVLLVVGVGLWCRCLVAVVAVVPPPPLPPPAAALSTGGLMMRGTENGYY